MRTEIINYLSQHHIDIYVPDFKVCTIAMIAIALILSTFMAAKKDLPVLKFYLVSVLICICSFLGGKIFYELRNYNQNLSYSVSEILLRGSGESVGTHIGGIVGAFIFLKWMKIEILTAFDVYAPVLALTLSIGRLGCFMSGCCFGKPTSLPWAISFPRDSIAYAEQLSSGMITSDFSYSLPVHPTQIYEAFFGLIMFFLLLILNRKKRINGLSMFIYLISYAVFRFFIEFIRGDDRGYLFSLSVPQIFCIFLFLLGSVGMAYCYSNYKKTPQEEINL